MTITTILDTLPTAPSRKRPNDFSEEMDNFLYAIVPFQSDVNDIITEMNATAVDVNADRAASLSSETNALAYEQVAMANAAFKGNWTSLTGALSIPASVRHDDKYWLLTSNLTDVTAKEPGVDAEWEIINTTEIGDILFSTESAADMLERGYLPCDNSTYLQTAYPALFAKLGTKATFSTAAVMPELVTDLDIVLVDDNYIYAAEYTSYTLYVIDKSDFSIVTGTPTFSSLILDMTQDANYLYVCTNSSPYLVVIDKSDWSVVSGTPTLAGAVATYGNAIVVDDSSVVISISASPYLVVIDKSDWSVVSGTPTLESRTYYVLADTTYIYTLRNASPFIYRINRSTWAVNSGVTGVSELSFSLKVFLQNSTYLIVGGQSSNQFFIIDKATWTLTSLISQSITVPSAGDVDENYLYLGRSSVPYLTIYDLSTGYVVSDTVIDGPITRLLVDDDYIYSYLFAK